MRIRDLVGFGTRPAEREYVRKLEALVERTAGPESFAQALVDLGPDNAGTLYIRGVEIREQYDELMSS